LNLPATGLRIAGGLGRARGPDLAEERVANGHRDVVFLSLQSIGAGDAAAVVVHVDRVQARYQGEQVERRETNPVTSKLAGSVVRQRLRERPEGRVELP